MYYSVELTVDPALPWSRVIAGQFKIMSIDGATYIRETESVIKMKYFPTSPDINEQKVSELPRPELFGRRVMSVL